jgi:hypothetical protein
MEKLIEALQILLKYDNPKYPTHCEHDVLYINVDNYNVSNDDKARLEALGVIENDENGKFMSFRYGAC